ncbi:vWA domain-containing protein [Oceanirhabdus sp. W0125-5]|uniref:vWA domain-containing protein n=1 Tax=Oceanirhabdus sp. W0125-5 TaxID=2999116 RepID=UPI0022F32DFC|nr:VWA domain-containing protein [Oceanirhabdus sp. W0125-5]WBW98253.1 VWA domain-containing protein [Oceanirhabdus sp. W0125-5]
MRFANWYFFLLIPLVVYVFLWKKNKSAIKFSSVKLLMNSGMKKTIKHRIGKYFICAGVILLITALARPQLIDKEVDIKGEGIDIAVVLDISGSMESVDLKPNRLEAAKKTIEDFINERPNDRISLIIFAGSAYTKIPLTLDHNIIKESLVDIDSRYVKEEGTAIGMALSVGLNRLKKSESKSKIIILVTDGDNNAGAINPVTAAKLAKDMDVKIYSIGVGTDTTIMPTLVSGKTIYKKYQGGLNEKLLEDISHETGGKYYRARYEKALSQIFSTINKLEKTEFDNDNFIRYKELGFMFIRLGFILLTVGIFMDRYYYMQIP